MKKIKVIIIGAGLSGLVTAYLLQKKGIECIVLEANARMGGRIETITGATSVTMEMGATWFSRQHQLVFELINELGLNYFEQYTQGISLMEMMSGVPLQTFQISEYEESSYRIAGGTITLIDKLAAIIGSQRIITHKQVTAIHVHNNQVEVRDSKGGIYFADKVVTTLPPHLLVQTINFEPSLPESFLQLAKRTHTWMGESIKIAVEYKTPFWRENHFSGALFSHSSIVQEMYDHSTFDHKGYALKGFLNVGTYTLPKDERKEKVIAQLTAYFGAEAKHLVAYHEKMWRVDPLTFFPYEHDVTAHQNNGHLGFQKAFLDDKLLISGSETATLHPGYMDGAIFAAYKVAANIIAS